MPVNYNGTTYNSKAEVCRLMYDNGEVEMNANSKKAVAAHLGMTVQTVHATLKKYLDKKGELPKSSQTPKPTTNRSQINKPQTAIIIKENIDGDEDDGDGYNNYNRPKKGQIFITSAPNKYGLPVTNPPIEIRTKEYAENN